MIFALLLSAMVFGTLSITGQTRSKSQKIEIKTITGYFCSDGGEGQVTASKFLRTTQGVMEFSYVYRLGPLGIGKLTPFYGFKKKGSNKIGAEYIVKYVTNESNSTNVFYDAQSFTFRGKAKKIKPCSVEYQKSYGMPKT